MARRATITDVAAHAGVSIKTVSRVLNNEPHVAPDVKRSVHEAMDELNFTANPVARRARRTSSRTRIIAQLYGDPGGYYTHDIQVGLLGRCQHFDCHLVIEELDYRSPHLARDIGEFLERVKPDGAVLTAPLTDNDVVLSALAQTDVPYVLIAPLRDHPSAPSVSVDEKRAAFDMTQHLLSFGHRRIGFLRGLENHAATHLRYEGFSLAMAQAGLEIDTALVENGGFRYLPALTAAHSLLAHPNRPTAIFASNDEMASAVMKAAYERGLRLPEDLSIVGFDDIPMAEMLWPPLTTVRQNVVKLGAAAGNMLFNRLFPTVSATWPNPVPRLIQPYDIVLRGSTAPMIPPAL